MDSNRDLLYFFFHFLRIYDMYHCILIFFFFNVDFQIVFSIKIHFCLHPFRLSSGIHHNKTYQGK